MGVQLNIKDEETVRLARKLANDLGTTVTAAIRDALREKAEKLPPERKRATVEEIMAIGHRASKHWKPEFDHLELSTQHGHLLYDEDEAPR